MPLSLQEAAPKPVPDDQNAALLYQEVFKVQFPPWKPPVVEGQMAGRPHEERGLFGSYLKQPTPELEKQVRALLARPQAQKALQTLREASHKPFCVFPVNWEDGAGALFPHLSKFKTASQMLTAQALLSACDGRLQEALDWCQVSLRMSEHAASEPTLIAQLVAIAIQAITFNAVKHILYERRLEPGVANDFQEYLSRIDLRKTFTDGMIGERAMGIETIEGFRRGVYGREELPTTPTYNSSIAWPLWKLDELTYIDYMSRVVEAQRLPYARGVAEIESANKECEDLPFYQVFAKMLIPVFSRAIHKRAQATANIGLCRVVLALKAYKYERGAYPDSLDQLQQTLDWELPEDPFSGTEFIYQRHGEGFILYSIGQDLEDDGGMPERDEQGKWRGDESDIVWQCRR